MKNKVVRVFFLGLLSLAITSIGVAQKEDKKASAASSLYVISAKAGAVNYVSGKVSLERSEAPKDTLQKGDTVEVGDKVITQSDGKAEVLLNPGSYVRLAENSEFEFVTTSLDDLQVKINRGSAILEVIANKEFKIAVNTPNSKFYLIKSGVFRIDVLDNGLGKISVWDGRAQVGDNKATVVKGGRSAVFSNTQATVEKFNRRDKSEFDNWSRERAKEIAKINAKLVQRQMNQSLIHSYNRNGWGANGYGLWVQDPSSRSFCFLPFGWGWSSPYGFGYSQSIWSYQLPRQIIAPMVYENPNLNNPNNGQTVMTPPPTNTNYPTNNGGGFPNTGGSTGGQQPSIAPPPRERERGIEQPRSMERQDNRVRQQVQIDN